jgi:hypothetical protein
MTRAAITGGKDPVQQSAPLSNQTDRLAESLAIL